MTSTTAANAALDLRAPRPSWRRRATRAASVLGVSYLAGSIPFSNLVARRKAGVDLRDVGSGTVSGSGLYDVAGLAPLVAAGLADVTKGAIGPILAGRDHPVLGALAGGAAVCGHNWSVFLGGAGGRGFSPSLGALAVGNWPGSATLLGAFVLGGAVGQEGLGCFAGYAAVVPVLARTRGRAGALAGTAVVLPLVAKRLLGNRPPPDRRPVTYAARLLLDRDTWHEPEPDPAGAATP